MSDFSRRDFLKRFSAAAAVGTAAIVAGVELDPEFLLWKPGERKFFLPSPKPLVTDLNLVQGEYDALVTMGATDIRAVRDVLQGRVAHRVHTAMGVVESDAAWNVIRIGGRTVSAREAAQARLQHYNRDARIPEGAQSVQAMTEQIIADRITAGWSDPIGEQRHPRYARHGGRRQGLEREYDEARAAEQDLSAAQLLLVRGAERRVRLE